MKEIHLLRNIKNHWHTFVCELLLMTNEHPTGTVMTNLIIKRDMERTVKE